ncbi:hypothetical protein WDU94_010621, partial [Cyamophila willieti]
IFVNSNIPQWRTSRKTITGVFSFAVLKRYVRIFHTEGLVLVSKWQQRAESSASFNPEEDINLATFDMVMVNTLGLNPKAQQNPEDQAFMHNVDKLFEDIAKLDYLEMVIKESLRMFPAAPVLSRSVDEDYDLGDGKILPAGTQVFVSIYSLHRNPAYYPHPHSFDPSRWTPEAAAQRPANCFIPFSTGPRNCIGAKYAMLAMKTFLADLLRCFRILPADECASMDDIGFDIQMTLKMNANCKIRLKKRYTGEICT